MGANRCIQVGLAARVVVYEPATDPEPFEVLFYVTNQIEVRVAAGGVKRHQFRQQPADPFIQGRRGLGNIFHRAPESVAVADIGP